MNRTDPFALLRYLDIVVVLAAAPFVVLAGLPVLGYAVAAFAWILQRVIAVKVDAYARSLDDIRRAVGFNVGTLLARVWIIGLAIVLVGTQGSHEDGVMASATCLIALTIYFATVLMGRSVESAK
jgi:hypothetical protein